ncbi:inositol monophosphatase family protein [Reichenbachiella versicolor]|uniref:inositol monophosphatase family protein n=1 Tax=Reichenbachiella versicolor TaxID=1821036 RepID=UPI0013A52DC4|nr:inositol monophosphatase family protein [Reichenbachiella versicolor]
MVLKQQHFEELCELAITAGNIASQYIQSKVGKSYAKESKAGGDSLASQVVTEVDIKSEKLIIDVLSDSMRKYDLGLLMEETTDDQSRLEKDFFWCIDPIDGTLPFTEQRKGYAVSIGLISKQGNSVIGVAVVPDQQDVYSAIIGDGLKKNGLPINLASNETNIIDVFTGNSFESESYFDFVKTELEHYASETGMVISYQRGFGGVVNVLELIASGRGCFFKFPKKNLGCGSIWDYAAVRVFFEEVNAYVCNGYGNTLHLNQSESTFMNTQGAIFATHEGISDFLVELSDKVLKKTF